MKLSCNIVQDLIPLYLDNVCSPDSRQAIEAHIRCCEECRKLAGQAAPIPQFVPEHPEKEKSLKKGLKKLRFRWAAALLTLVILIPLAFLGGNAYSIDVTQTEYVSQIDTATELANAFVEDLTKGDYAAAFALLDLESTKAEWLKNWYEESELVNFEADAKAKFLELGAALEDAGGIESWELLSRAEEFGISWFSYGVHEYTFRYSIICCGEAQTLTVTVKGDAVSRFDNDQNIWTDPLAQLSIWSELLWEDYQGCYFDPEAGTYVYYDAE